MSYNKIANVVADGGERGPTGTHDNSRPLYMMSIREKAYRQRKYILSRDKTTTNELAIMRASFPPAKNNSGAA